MQVIVHSNNRLKFIKATLYDLASILRDLIAQRQENKYLRL